MGARLYTSLSYLDFNDDTEQCTESSFTCLWNKAQMGYDIAHMKTSSRETCSRKCCENNECIGFDWVTPTQDCWLSKTPRSKVPLIDHKKIWSCEKRNPKRGMNSMY